MSPLNEIQPAAAPDASPASVKPALDAPPAPASATGAENAAVPRHERWTDIQRRAHHGSNIFATDASPAKNSLPRVAPATVDAPVQDAPSSPPSAAPVVVSDPKDLSLRDLRAACRERGLNPGGGKPALEERLAVAIAAGACAPLTAPAPLAGSKRASPVADRATPTQAARRRGSPTNAPSSSPRPPPRPRHPSRRRTRRTRRTPSSRISSTPRGKMPATGRLFFQARHRLRRQTSRLGSRSRRLRARRRIDGRASTGHGSGESEGARSRRVEHLRGESRGFRRGSQRRRIRGWRRARRHALHLRGESRGFRRGSQRRRIRGWRRARRHALHLRRGRRRRRRRRRRAPTSAERR